MTRRSLLAALASAPLIARPTLEEIERLTWRRKLFPGWSAPFAGTLGRIVTMEGFYAIDPRTFEALPYLQEFVVTDDGGCSFSPVPGRR